MTLLSDNDKGHLQASLIEGSQSCGHNSSFSSGRLAWRIFPIVCVSEEPRGRLQLSRGILPQQDERLWEVLFVVAVRLARFGFWRWSLLDLVSRPGIWLRAASLVCSSVTLGLGCLRLRNPLAWVRSRSLFATFCTLLSVTIVKLAYGCHSQTLLLDLIRS